MFRPILLRDSIVFGSEYLDRNSQRYAFHTNPYVPHLLKKSSLTLISLFLYVGGITESCFWLESV